MKTQRKVDTTKLGLFVLSGLVFLILLLYMIGRNRNLLGKRFIVKALMEDVSGLVAGNNVRFKGIDVGTVKSIEIENDSSIMLTMVIDEKVKPFIRKNAIVSIGTDGLMGNKLVNINSQRASSMSVADGDTIGSVKQIETTEILRSLGSTSKTVVKISDNLYEISNKLNNSHSLWTVLSDTSVANDLKSAVAELRASGKNTSSLTRTANRIVKRFDEGNGVANQIFTDTVLSRELSESMHELKQTIKTTSAMVNELNQAISAMNKGEGTAGLVLKDSLLREKISESVNNLSEGSRSFNQNMDAMKSNFLFRGYFRKLEKRQKEDQRQQGNKSEEAGAVSPPVDTVTTTKKSY